MRLLSAIFSLLVACASQAQNISYFNQGLLRQPSAEADRVYLGITNLFPGAGITFTPNGPLGYTISAGGGLSQYVLKSGDTMSGSLTNLSYITVNSTNTTAYLRFQVPDPGFPGSILFSQIQFDNAGFFTVFAPTIFNSGLYVDHFIGTHAAGITGLGTFFGNGSGITNIPAASIASPPWQTNNQTVTVTISGDATGSGSGTTSISITLNCTNGAHLAGVLASAIVGAVAQATHATNADNASAGWPTTWPIASIVTPGQIFTNGNTSFISLSNNLAVTGYSTNGTGANPTRVGPTGIGRVGAACVAGVVGSEHTLGVGYIILNGNTTPYLAFYDGSQQTMIQRTSIGNLTLTTNLTVVGYASAAKYRFPTNAAPTGVTIGVTAPDFWHQIYDATGTKMGYSPVWTNH